MSSSESRRQEVTEQMWHAAEDCSGSGQRRMEMLCRRIESRVRGTDSSWDEAERRRLRNSDSAGWWSSSARYNGARPWRHFCKPERPACGLSAVELSASVIGVGAALCGRTLMTRRQAVRPRSSPIASAVQGVMECQPTLHCSSPAAVAPDTTPVTGRQS